MILPRLIIPRRLWGLNSLLNPDGTMCCLGHAAKACGVPDNRLLGVGLPERDLDVPAWMLPRYNGNSDIVGTSARGRASTINDDQVMPVDRKEEALIKLFGSMGTELTFVGDYGTSESAQRG